MDIGWISLFHPDGRTAATDIPRERKKLALSDHFHAFVVRCSCRQLEVYLLIARYDADEQSGLIASQYQRLEHLSDILAQLLCHMDGREVSLVRLVGDQFVRYMRRIQKARHIGLGHLSGHFRRKRLRIKRITA